MTTPAPTGRAWVEPPPREPYAYGLIDAATVVDGDGKWQVSGVEYFSDACVQGGYVIGACPKPATTPPPQTSNIVLAPQATTYTMTVGRLNDKSTRAFEIRVPLDAPDDVRVRLQAPGSPAPAPIFVTVPPGSIVPFDPVTEHGQPINGNWTVTFVNAANQQICTPITVPVPYAAGTADFGSCAQTVNRVRLTAAPNNAFPVVYRLRKPGGAVAGAGILGPSENVYIPTDSGNNEITFEAEQVPTRIQTIQVPGDILSFDFVRNLGTATSHDKPMYDGLNLVQGSQPFTVYARAQCNAVGFDDASQRALDRLSCVEPREVEKFFARYMLGAPDIRKPRGDNRLSLKLAIGVLEDDAAKYYCGRPVFHAPRWTAPYFADRLQLHDVQSTRTVLRGVLESKFVFGGGYYDNPWSPEGTPDGGFWLLVTGSVRMFRSEPFVNEAFDAGHPTTTPGSYTSSNTRVAIAERTYAIDHDCYRAAVLVGLQGEN